MTSHFPLWLSVNCHYTSVSLPTDCRACSCVICFSQVTVSHGILWNWGIPKQELAKREGGRCNKEIKSDSVRSGIWKACHGAWKTSVTVGMLKPPSLKRHFLCSHRNSVKAGFSHQCGCDQQRDIIPEEVLLAKNFVFKEQIILWLSKFNLWLTGSLSNLGKILTASQGLGRMLVSKLHIKKASAIQMMCQLFSQRNKTL